MSLQTASLAGIGALAAGMLAVAGLGAAQAAQAVCSVFDGKPCTPYSCSVFDPSPCSPEVQYPIGGGLRSTVQRGTLEQPPTPAKPLRKLHDLFAALSACWVPPPLAQALPGMQISVRLSFKRNGEILGRPFITYQTHDATKAQRRAYRIAMAEALARCTPLPFSKSLGNALAGRPITVRFIDNRKLIRAEAI